MVLWGLPSPTSVHTHETSPQPPGFGESTLHLSAFDRILERRLTEGLNYYGRYSSGFAYERSYYQGAPASPGETARRHAWWEPERAQVRAAMASAGLPAARLDRFDQCGAASFILCNKTDGRLKRAMNKCRDRHCKPCAIDRANIYAGNVRKRLDAYAGRLNRRFRFVTLTLRSNTEPLPKQFRRWMEAFTRLRRVKLCNLRRRKLLNWWGLHVVGGCYFLEATINQATGQWHVHAHLIVEGSYLPHQELKALWHLATGDSDVVDIRELSGVDDVAAEVSKYTSKGAGAKLTAAGVDKLAEWVIGTKSLRLCSTFGTWRGFRLAAGLDDFNPGQWINFGREDDIRARAHAGDEWAKRLVSDLEKSTDANKKRRPPPRRLQPVATEPA